MDTQQLAAKVAQLETRVAALEDEGKIVKGEVKQVLTEIRSAVLARENPFDNTLPSLAAMQPAAAPEQPVLQAQPAAPVVPTPTAELPVASAEPSREPIPLRTPVAALPAHVAGMTAAAPMPQWSLLTISGLSAWAEDAMRRLGALRVEILLDLCEASGHLTTDARKALSRITEMEMPEPQQAPSTNETAAILRELDALISEDEEQPSIRLSRAA